MQTSLREHFPPSPCAGHAPARPGLRPLPKGGLYEISRVQVQFVKVNVRLNADHARC